MVKKWRAVLLLLALSLLVSLAAFDDAGAQQKNFLWRARAGRATIYLFGSVHLLKPTAYPLNPVIERAFDQSSFLVVEANVNDTGAVNAQSLLSKALYREGDSLDRHVSAQTYRLIERKSASLGLPAELLRGQKPWFLALTFEALELLRLGFDPQYGVDNHFLSKAGSKRILELESVDEQIALLSGMSDLEQEAFLLYTLKDLETLAKEADTIVRAWKAGDTGAIEAVIARSQREDPGLAPVLRKLLDERNSAMVSKIEGYLRTDQTYFVVVGAGHLVGDKGIVNALKRRGYRVEQL